MNKITKLMVVTTSIAILAMFNVATAETNTVSETNDTPVLTGIGGPDQFGYRWIDSDQAWGPEYEWVDISEIGTRVDMDTVAYEHQPIAILGPYDIGFEFPFYGNTYNEIKISPFGYITFDDADYSSYSSRHIIDNYSGDEFPNNFIAMLWTLVWPYSETFTNGDSSITEYDRPVYYYNDVENNRFIISYHNSSYHSSDYHCNVGLPVSDLTFQVILYADGRILMQYNTMFDGDCDEIDWDVFDEHRNICKYNNETATIGIKNAAGDDGLEVAFCEPYIHDSLAILFYPAAIYDYDIAPLSLISPTEPWQVPNSFVPTVTFENQGAIGASFNVNLTISYGGSVVYNESQSFSDLESLASTDIEFPEYTPADSGIYTLTAVSLLDSDQNVLNDTITIDFEVQPEYLPPVYLSAVNSQNGVVPLKWDEPGTPACSLIAYDNNHEGGSFYFVAPNQPVYANEFNCSTPAELCSVFVRVSSDTYSDIMNGWWPDWPEAIHDSMKVYVISDDGTGMPVDTLADLTLVANYNSTGWITQAFDPPLVIENGKFWVGYGNISTNGRYDALIVDEHINYPEVQWFGDENGVWNDSVIFFYDYKIRASVRVDGIDISDNGLDIVGYNIYRDTEPDVDIDESNLIVEQTTETSFNDEDVENGTIYYYVSTVVYTDGENTIESIPSGEVSATPANGGQLASSEESIEIGPIFEGIDTTQIVLTNDGDLDVSFSTVLSTEDELLLAKAARANRAEISQENGYFFLGTRENGYKVDSDSPIAPVVTGFAVPDEYGYIWLDSDETQGPDYNWIDPSEHEQLGDLVDDDDISDRIYLDFDFPFYGNIFNSLYISRYGWISFTDNLSSIVEASLLPDDGDYTPTNLVTPFWAWLQFTRLSSYISFYSDNSKAVISWVDASLYNYFNSSANNFKYTFQIVLYPDGRILFQYKEMSGDTNCGVAGIQNEDGTIASQVVGMTEYVHDELATLIQVPWLRIEPSVGIVPANSSLTLDVISNPTGLEPDTYVGNIDIVSGDINGSLDDINITVNMVRTDIEEEESALIPVDYDLLSNFPNPFNATTSIRFALSKADNVSLDVYDVSGRLTRSLYSGELSAGTHSIVWDGTNQSGDKVSSGIYFYRLKTSDETRNNRMILLK